MILVFAQGKPIWHDISSRYNRHQNHALVPVYTKDSTLRIRQHFDLVRRSALQTSNPSAVLQDVLNDPKIQQLNLSASDIEAIYTLSERLLNTIYERGFLQDSLPREATRAGFVLIRETGRPQQLIESRLLITSENLHAFFESSLSRYDLPVQLLTESLVELFLQQNLSFQGLEREMIHEVSPILLRQERIGVTLYVLMTSLLLLLIVYHLYHEQITKIHRFKAFSRRYYMLLILTLSAVVSTFVILVLPVFLDYNIPRIMFSPGVIFAFMITFLFGVRNGLLFSLYYTLIVMLALGFEMLSSLYLVSSIIFAVYLASLCKNRSQLFFASIWQALMNLIIIITLTMSSATEELGIGIVLTAIISGLLISPIALGISPIIERLLNLPSNYRLLDLCDLNSPTMRRLQYLAPGTYTHSLNVAILAENACQRIHANGLLARVGSYYHDIGKMENPEYFVENQAGGVNKHNQMKANLSAAMIRGHVRIGLEIGKSMGLPQEVLDIISQHHGKSLVSFFYMRAKDELSEHEQSVNEADFRYPGPRPQTKESAVVMLADSVEAASHTLKKPTQSSITKLIDAIVGHKLETGELDESPLTLRDISRIKASLIQSLVGQYHHRIEYPDTKNEAKA
jgi:putative nucleotidyltransferase with HDIG domain